MYFKFIIVIIPFFLATNSVMGNLDDLFQKSYNYAREIYYTHPEEGLKSIDISNFMEHANYEVVDTYFNIHQIKPEDQENINFELFTIIIKDYCDAHEYEYCTYLNKRIEELKLEVQECKELYDLVKSQYTSSSEKKLTDSNLIDFFGFEEDITKCLRTNNVSNEDRKNIDLTLFTKVVRAVCKSNVFFERQFLLDRQNEIKGKAEVVEEEEEE